MGNKPTSSRASSDCDRIDDKFVNEFQKKLPEKATNVLVGEKLLPQSEGYKRDIAPPRVGKEGFLLGVVTMKEALADSTSPFSVNLKTNSEVSSKVAPKKFFAIYRYCSTHRNSSCYCIVVANSGNLSSCRLSQLSVLGCNYVMMMKLR